MVKPCGPRSLRPECPSAQGPWPQRPHWPKAAWQHRATGHRLVGPGPCIPWPTPGPRRHMGSQPLALKALGAKARAPRAYGPKARGPEAVLTTVNIRSTYGQHTVNIRSTYGQHNSVFIGFLIQKHYFMHAGRLKIILYI